MSANTPPPQTVDYRAEAAAMFPWLRGQLLDTYADLWAETGSTGAALSKLRDTGVYQRTFPGIVRDDGTLRMGENEYLSQMVGFREVLDEFEVDVTAADLSRLIELEVDAREFAQVVNEGVQRFREPGVTRDNGLTAAFTEAFMQTGSRSAALDQIRSSSTYGQVFAGNRRDDGSLVMQEDEYLAYKREWQRLFISRGLNPEPFEAKGRLADAVQAELSVRELDARLSAVEQGLLANTESTRQFFAQQYGQEGSQYLSAIDADEVRPAALAMAIDPDVGNELLQRRITASQIGGEAAVQGFARSLDRAEELARAGITQGQARTLYGRAAAQLPGLSATTRRFRRGETSLSEFESAFALSDASEQGRLERALQEEQSSFSSRLDTRRDRDGGLTGLRQR